MRPLQVLAVALKALLLNKTRSLLTVLGIVIGVAAVIVMVAIGEGAKRRVEQAFSAMGTNVLVVLSGTTRTGGLFGGFGSLPTLTWEDLRAIREELPAVLRAAPQTQAAMQLIGPELNWNALVYGVQPTYFDIRNWQAASGALFGDADVDGANQVAVLGTTVVRSVFGPNANPVGQTLRIKNVPFRVIGVAASKGQSATGQDYDDAVFVPITTYVGKLQGSLSKFIPGAIFIQATSDAATPLVQRQVTALLRDRHRLRAGDEDDFNIRNLQELVDAQLASTRTITTLLAALAAVSLVVGGIGIMNIMLVSVTERTREIGLRMALGATPGTVLAQFLAEALALSMVGGLMGVAAGVALAGLLARRFGLELLLRGDIVAISLACSAAVGIFFGVYPARRASRLDPVVALHHE